MPILLLRILIDLIVTGLLGSIVGAAIIVTGFYGVVWAQSKEEEEVACSSSSKTPLLHEPEPEPNPGLDA